MKRAVILLSVLLAGCADKIVQVDPKGINDPKGSLMIRPDPLPDMPACSIGTDSDRLKCRVAYDTTVRRMYASVGDRLVGLQMWAITVSTWKEKR